MVECEPDIGFDGVGLRGGRWLWFNIEVVRFPRTSFRVL